MANANPPLLPIIIPTKGYHPHAVGVVPRTDDPENNKYHERNFPKGLPPYAHPNLAYRLPENVAHTFTPKLSFDCDGHPLNPAGSNGKPGRGDFARWGSNQAGDPVVTRWKEGSDKKIIQVCLVLRKDTKEWALPGGFVDVGEQVSATVKREFGEECLSTLHLTDDDDVKTELLKKMDDFFKNGVLIYQGPNWSDPRTRIHAWAETTVFGFHDADGTTASRFPLCADPYECGKAQWVDVTEDLELYSDHKIYLDTWCEYVRK